MYHPDVLPANVLPDRWQGRWTSPQACPALVLNADYTPLSYYPLSLWSWQDAVKASFLERVDVIAQYDREIRSPSFVMRLPSVVALRQYVKPSTHPAFTRFNLFLRDRFTCQYCGSGHELTFDHVVPRAYGGRTPAEAHMLPRNRPVQPTAHQLQENGRGFPPHYCHETWRDYLYWDTELEA